ncbi:hypothetical protein J6590_033487 [Homalodisca vitripennis]|nr:hypothetical protein J6590_033487 [Homalodisca vitripennis]
MEGQKCVVCGDKVRPGHAAALPQVSNPRPAIAQAITTLNYSDPWPKVTFSTLPLLTGGAERRGRLHLTSRFPHLDSTFTPLLSHTFPRGLRLILGKGSIFPECFTLADSVLEETKSTKFLGILLDQGLTWSAHIDKRTVILQKKAIRIIANMTFYRAFKNLQLLTLPCLYTLETVSFCMSKCTLMRGRDVHRYETRGRENYRSGKHRTVVYEHLPSQAGVHFFNRLPPFVKNAPTPKALKTRLKRLASMAFYNVGEFFARNWETTHFENRP